MSQTDSTRHGRAGPSCSLATFFQTVLMQTCLWRTASSDSFKNVWWINGTKRLVGNIYAVLCCVRVFYNWFNWERHEINFTFHSKEHPFCLKKFIKNRRKCDSCWSLSETWRRVFQIGNCTVLCVSHAVISNVTEEGNMQHFKVEHFPLVAFCGFKWDQMESNGINNCNDENLPNWN